MTVNLHNKVVMNLLFPGPSTDIYLASLPVLALFLGLSISFNVLDSLSLHNFFLHINQFIKVTTTLKITQLNLKIF